MSSVDNRIIRLQFDTSKFTNAAKQAMTTLTKMDEKLHFTQGMRALSKLPGAFNKVNTGKLSNGVQSVTNKFSAMDIIGTTALSKLTLMAMDSGLKIAKSLTIDPIKMGFDEYELKMGAVQTIMSSTGADIDTVNKYLEDLNRYSDRTIYSFADMTQNISKFTNAGVGLEDSVKAIQGVANVAAAAGANAENASHAMYNFGQAMSGGSMQMVDWMSIEQANMATVEFKQTLVDTAVEMGTLVKVGERWQSTTVDGKGHISDVFDSIKGFNYSLSHNWMTTEVVTAALGKYADETTNVGAKAFKSAQDVKTFSQMMDTLKESAQSGWAMSSELIFGNLTEGITLWTEMKSMIESGLNALSSYRNENLALWKAEGGREKFWQAIKNIMSGIGKIISPIAQSFAKILNPYGVDNLMWLTNGFLWLSEKLIITDKTAEMIGSTFDGIFSIVKALGNLLKPFGAILAGSVTLFQPLTEIIYEVGAAFGNATERFLKWADSTGLINNIAGGIMWAAQELSNGITWMFNNSDSWFNKFLGDANTEITNFINWVGFKGWEAKEQFKAWIAVTQPLEAVTLIFHKCVAWIQVTMWELSDSIDSAGIAVNDGINRMTSGFKSVVGWLGKVWTELSNAFNRIVQLIKEGITWIQNALGGIEGIDILHAGILGGLFLGLKSLYTGFKNFINSFGGIGPAITGMFNSIGGSFNSLSNVFKKMLPIMDEFSKTLKLYQKDLKAEILMKLAKAILILVGAVLILSFIPPDKLKLAVAAVAGMMVGLVGSMKLLEMIKISPTSMKATIQTIGFMIGIGIACTFLAVALSRIAALGWEGIAVGLVGMIAMMASLVILSDQMSKFHVSSSTTKGVHRLAKALLPLSLALALLGLIPIDNLLQGIGVMAGFLLASGVFLNATKGVQNATSTCGGLMTLSLAMIGLAGAIALFGNIPIDVLQQGCIVMAGVLIGLGVFMAATKKVGKNMIGMGVGLILLATAMAILAGGLKLLGSLPIEPLIQGLKAMGIALLLIALTMELMPENMIAQSIAIGILSVSLVLMSKALAALGALSFGTIITGLAALAGVMLTLGGLGLLLSEAAVPMLIASGAIAVMGLSFAVAGWGLMVLSAGITTIAGSLIATGVGLAGMITALAATIPVIMAALALGIVSFITVLGYNSEALGRAFTDMINAAYQTLIDTLPKFLEWVQAALDGILQIIWDTTPKIMETLIYLFTELIRLLNEKMPLIVEYVVGLLMTLIEYLTEQLPILADTLITFMTELIITVLEGLGEGTTEIIEALVTLIENMLNTLSENTWRIVQAAWDFVIDMINGLADSVSTNLPRVSEAMWNLVDACVEALGECVDDFLSCGGDIVQGIIDGITGGLSDIWQAGKNLGKKLYNSVCDFFDINSPSRVMMGVGKFVNEGLGRGISDNYGIVTKRGRELGKTTMKSVQDALEKSSKNIDTSIGLSPTIKPVLDLSNVQNGSRNISSMFNGTSVRASMNGITGRINPNSLGGSSTITNTTTTNSSADTTTNHFHISGNDPKAIANEVSKIIQQKTDRRKVAWA